MFTSDLDTRLVGEYCFRLLTPLVYENNRFKITLCTGLESDGASIPRAFWTHAGCPFGGLYSRSAVLHDALYRSRLFDKDTCDDLFLEAMEKDGVPYNTRVMLYGAVVTFGGSSYDNTSNMQMYRDLIQIEPKLDTIAEQ